MKDYIKNAMILGAIVIACYMFFYAGYYKSAAEIHEKKSEDFMRVYIVDLIKFQVGLELSNPKAIENE